MDKVMTTLIAMAIEAKYANCLKAKWPEISDKITIEEALACMGEAVAAVIKDLSEAGASSEDNLNNTK